MALRLNHADDGLAETHEINVTPFIDVMLVLLVIFMITAPLSTVDIPVNLPVASAEQKPPPHDPVYVSLRSDLSIAIGEDAVARENLAAVLGTATQGDNATTIFVRGDKAVPYGDFMMLMNQLRDAGYVKVALVGLEQQSDAR